MRRRNGTLLVATLVVAFAAQPRMVRAEDPRARASQLFHEASEAYNHGQFAAAASTFEESHRLVPRAAALYNAALAWEAAGDPARAAEDYEGAVGRPDLPSDQAAGARQQLAALSRRLGVLDVLSPPNAHLAVGSTEGMGPRLHVYVEPGPHDVRVVWPDGTTATRTIDVAPGANEVARFEAPAVAVAPSAPSVPPSATPGAEAATRASPPTRPAPLTTSHASRTAGWIMLGSSVAFAGAAIVLGLEAIDARNRLEASNDTSTSVHDDAVRFRLLTNVAWGGAALGAALGGTLLVVSLTKNQDGASAPLAVLSGPGSIGVRGRF